MKIIVLLVVAVIGLAFAGCVSGHYTNGTTSFDGVVVFAPSVFKKGGP